MKFELWIVLHHSNTSKIQNRRCGRRTVVMGLKTQVFIGFYRRKN